MDELSEKKQQAAEQIISEIEELHRLRIHKKIRLTREEMNEETIEFLQRVAAAGVKRACEIQNELAGLRASESRRLGAPRGQVSDSES